MAMGEINHDFWNELFKQQTYENIDHNTLLDLIKLVENMKNDFSVMQQEFDEIYNTSFQRVIEQEKPNEDMSEEVQRNTACTSTATQQNTENDAKSKENIEFLEQLQEEITEKLEKIDLTKQRMTDNTPSEIDDEKRAMMSYNKYLQCVEIMHQHEIRRVIFEIIYYGKRYYSIRDEVRIAVQTEYFMHQINLISKFLEFEDEVLKLKLERERMTTEGKMGSVESAVMSCKIDHEKSKLMIDNKYLWFVETIQQKEINKIFAHFQIYCDIYNIPNEEVKIATHRDFILQRIEKVKKTLDLKEEIMDFNLQIDQETTNVERKDAETSNMTSKIDNVKSTLMKKNNYLRYIAMKHQKEIKSVYTQLQMFCNRYNKEIEEVKAIMHPNVGANGDEKTDIDESSKLKKNNEYLRSVGAKYEEEFIRIYNQLQMYRDRYHMPDENVIETIFMHTKSYIFMKTHDVENELIMDNEYFAFVAMTHLEKIREICVFFELHCNRFTFEEVAKSYGFMKPQFPLSQEIFLIQNHILMLKKELEMIRKYEKSTMNKDIRCEFFSLMQKIKDIRS